VVFAFLHFSNTEVFEKWRRIPALQEPLNKSVQDFSEHEKQKTWFLLFFIFQTRKCLKNGGASLHRRNL